MAVREGEGRHVAVLLWLATSVGAAGALSGQATPSPLPFPAGPLFTEEGAPIQRLGLTPMTEGADPVPRGGFRAELWFGYSNVFEQDSTGTHNLYLDMERLVTAVTGRYGLAGGLEIGARVTLETTWGGFLDPVVVGLHDLLSLGSRNRGDYPEGEYGQSLVLDGRTVVDVERTGLALEDVRFFGKWRVFGSPRSESLVSLKAVVRVPTRDNRVGQERADLGLMLLGRRRWRSVHLHGLLGGTTVRRSPSLEDVFTGRQFILMLGAEYPFSERISGIVQFTGSTQILRDVGDRDVDGPLTNTILGVVWRTEAGWRVEAALQEDTPPWGPSLDFTLQLGVSRAWH